jgi:hypothetical protein
VLVILEGANGVGKTTLARRLVECGYTRFKPFRPGSGPSGDKGHWDDPSGKTLFKRLVSLGVPVNSHAEDLFIADFLRQFPQLDVVLDRSIPSALAISAPKDIDHGELFTLWAEMLTPLRPLYVYMTADFDAAAQRFDNERMRDDAWWKRVDKAIATTTRLLPVGWEVLQLNTTQTSPDDVWRAFQIAHEAHRQNLKNKEIGR